MQFLFWISSNQPFFMISVEYEKTRAKISHLGEKTPSSKIFVDFASLESYQLPEKKTNKIPSVKTCFLAVFSKQPLLISAVETLFITTQKKLLICDNRDLFLSAGQKISSYSDREMPPRDVQSCATIRRRDSPGLVLRHFDFQQ